MGMRYLNQKSLKYMQDGGAAAPAQEVSLSQQVASMLQSGADPRSVAQQLLSSGVDEADIKEIFMDLGMAPSDVDALFQSEEEVQQELDQALAEAQAEESAAEPADQPEPADTEVEFGAFGNSMPEAQFGLETPLAPTINQYFGGIARQKGDDYVKNPMANYLPMDLGTKGNPVGAAFLLAEGYTDLFGGKTDPNTGLKEGFFRDVDVKKARQKAAVPSYYDYKVTTAAGDDKEYVTDKLDLYNAAKNDGSLRTKQQYAKDVAANSQVDFNPKTGQYEGVFSSRAIDKSLLGKQQQEDLNKFLEKSVSVKDLNDRFDPETVKMITQSQKEGMGSLGINAMGQASSYKDVEANPYLYETMMGVNTLQSKGTTPTLPGMEQPKGLPNYSWMNSGIVPTTSPVLTNTAGPRADQQAPMSFQDWTLQDPVRRMTPDAQAQYNLYIQSLPKQKDGGDIKLPKAQFGPPDWMMGSLFTTPTVVNDPQGLNNYFSSMGQTNYAQDTQAVADAQLQQRQPELGPTPQQQAAQNFFKEGEPVFTGKPIPPGAPKVEITNKLAGDINRVMDSRAMQGFGKVSNFAVNAAGFVNEMYKNKKAREAEARLYEMSQADNAFGYFEDPVNKQGTWDTNTGLAEQDNRVEYMRAQQGGEIGEIDLDPDTIARLIAAGANIQIL